MHAESSRLQEEVEEQLRGAGGAGSAVLRAPGAPGLEPLPPPWRTGGRETWAGARAESSICTGGGVSPAGCIVLLLPSSYLSSSTCC